MWSTWATGDPPPQPVLPREHFFRRSRSIRSEGRTLTAMLVDLGGATVGLLTSWR